MSLNCILVSTFSFHTTKNPQIRVGSWPSMWANVTHQSWGTIRGPLVFGRRIVVLGLLVECAEIISRRERSTIHVELDCRGVRQRRPVSNPGVPEPHLCRTPLPKLLLSSFSRPPPSRFSISFLSFTPCPMLRSLPSTGGGTFETSSTKTEDTGGWDLQNGGLPYSPELKPLLWTTQSSSRSYFSKPRRSGREKVIRDVYYPFDYR